MIEVVSLEWDFWGLGQLLEFFRPWCTVLGSRTTFRVQSRDIASSVTPSLKSVLWVGCSSQKTGAIFLLGVNTKGLRADVDVISGFQGLQAGILLSAHYYNLCHHTSYHIFMQPSWVFWSSGVNPGPVPEVLFQCVPKKKGSILSILYLKVRNVPHEISQICDRLSSLGWFSGLCGHQIYAPACPDFHTALIVTLQTSRLWLCH